MVAARDAENDGLLLEAAANADVEGLVPSAVLVNAVSATVEGSGVPVFATLAVLEVDGDELLDSARTEVLVGTSTDVAMIPVVLDHVDTCTRVPTAGADDDALLLKTFVDGVGVTVPVILEVFDDTNTFMVAPPVAENDVLRLEAAAKADVAVHVPLAVLVNTVSATCEG